MARNPKTSIKVLEVLSKDENYYVRNSVAGNGKTPIKILELLSKDENYHIRSSVSKNPNTPIKILKELLKDENYDIRYQAKEALMKIKKMKPYNEIELLQLKIKS